MQYRREYYVVLASLELVRPQASLAKRMMFKDPTRSWEALTM